jgi:hypothetical protein
MPILTSTEAERLADLVVKESLIETEKEEIKVLVKKLYEGMKTI